MNRFGVNMNLAERAEVFVPVKNRFLYKLQEISKAIKFFQNFDNFPQLRQNSFLNSLDPNISLNTSDDSIRCIPKVMQVMTLDLISFILKLAEIPGAALVNLQPVEHLLFCKQFSNMCPSAFSILGPPGPGGEGGRGQGSNMHQNLPWTGGDMLVKFHHVRCRGLDFH